MEKFSDYADVGFAVILLSADDKGSKKNDFPDKIRYRARQNVILELGYFLGRLGRDKVVALREKGKDIEIPSDFDGDMYTSVGIKNRISILFIRLTVYPSIACKQINSFYIFGNLPCPLYIYRLCAG